MVCLYGYFILREAQKLLLLSVLLLHHLQHVAISSIIFIQANLILYNIQWKLVCKYIFAQIIVVFVQTCRCITVCVCVRVHLRLCVCDFSPSSWAAGLGYFPRNVLDRQREADAFLSSQRRLQHMWRVARLVILNTPCAPCMWLCVCCQCGLKSKHRVRHLVANVQYFNNNDKNQPCKLWLIVFLNNENKTLFNLWSTRYYFYGGKKWIYHLFQSLCVFAVTVCWCVRQCTSVCLCLSDCGYCCSMIPSFLLS